jgi:ATP-dependent Clp protease protease subunit
MKYTSYKLIFWSTLLGVTTLPIQDLSNPLSPLHLAVTEAAAENITAECQAGFIQLETATPTTIKTDKAVTLTFAKTEKNPNTDDKGCAKDGAFAETDDESDTDADELDPQEQAHQKEILRLKRDSELLDAQAGKLASENEQMEQLLRQKQLKTELKQAAKPKYLSDPFVDGKLFISDRRIELNGEIDSDTADLVTKSIHFYNNEDPTYPIFLVINESPGGELMAGAHLIEVMQHSQAPVYVVVKRLAASMAAILVAQAPRSFAYPNALIIHHQASRIFFLEIMAQNEMEEDSQRLKEWSKRLLAPVAKKMGLTLEEFIKKMYEHSSTGEWAEFATEAQGLKWVDFVVSDLRETSITANPADRSDDQEVVHEASTEEEQAKVDRRRGEMQSGKQ